ncbi:MAG: hypothetical protein ABIK15_07290 [Pseudomonadota bacterium]
MRAFARQIITAAAVTAGMDADSIMDKPDKQNLLLPTPRMELEYMPEDYKRTFRKIVKFNDPPPAPEDPEDPEEPVTQRVIRSRIYENTLTVRAEVRTDDEAWLEAFVKDFILDMPHKTADSDNNLVTIKTVRAVRGGFGSKLVEVFKKRSNAIHITFTGMLCRDDLIPLIRDVNIIDGVTAA